MTTWYARRIHTKPMDDEHAAMCSVNIYSGDDWQEAKDAVIAYLTKTVQVHTERGNTVRKSGITVTDSYDKLVANETDALHHAVRWEEDKPAKFTSGGWRLWEAMAGDIAYQITGTITDDGA